MSLSSWVLTCILLTGSLVSAAQEESHEQSWEQQAADQGTLNAMEWEAPLRRKYSVNSITAEELSSLELLNALQVRAFISYRQKFGDLISLMELQAIPGWDPETVRKLLPHLTLQSEQPLAPLLRQRFREGQHRFLYRWSDNSRNDSAVFKGGSHLFSHRFQFRNLLQLGFTAEKDAGEKKIPDHVSGYAAMGNLGMIQKLLIGDFTVNMAQGLLHWQGYALGQTHDLVTGYRQGALFKPHTGTDENRFHRGLAIIIEKKRWEFSGFVSMQKIDAGLREDSSGISAWATGFQNSGLHRTIGELAGRKSLGWGSAGGRLRYRSDQHSTGIQFIYHGFDKVLMPDSKPYQGKGMTGKNFAGISLEHSHFGRFGFLFGEVALLPNGAYAMTGGWMKSLEKKFDLSVSGRMISREFAVFQSNALSASGEAKEEKGVFINFNFRPHQQHHLDGFFDRYVISRPRWGVDGIGYGRTWVAQYRWIPHKKAEIYVRWNHGIRNRNQMTTGQRTNGLVTVVNDRWRVHLSVKADMRWSFRIRNEWNQMMLPGYATETGRLHYIEIIYAPPLKPFSISIRTTAFETGDHDTRIYAYERDVMGYYAVPAHDGKGIRCYGLMQYRMGKEHRLSAKIIHDQRKGTVQQFWRLQWTWEP